jgi:hypothetical protein
MMIRDSLRPPAATPEQVEFALACLELLRDVYHPLVGEIDGMLETSGLARDDLLAYYFARHTPLSACTAFALLPPITREEITLVGRNYDWDASDRVWCEARDVIPESGLETLAYTHHWVGGPDAMNDVGLFVAISSLGPPEPVTGPGLQWNLIVDVVTYTCATVEEAVEVITGVPHLRPLCYLLADAEGEAAVVEARPSGTQVRRPEGDVLIATNCVVAGQVDTEVECRRYQRVAELVSESPGTLDVGNVKRILSDHEAMICRGDHGKTEAERAAAGEFQTLWSVIAVPQIAAFMVAPGLPCRTPHQLIPFQTLNEDE